jgi:hypothetical protein
MLLVAPLVASVGCSSVGTSDWNLAKSLDVRRAMWWKSDQPDPQLPDRMVSTWTDTVLHKPGQKSKRGFGGRLVFFGRESDDPVCVDGQLVVYAYDEAVADERTAQPTRRFIFPREQFTRHYSEATLGPSYSVWLPWDEVGGERKNISLIARFEPHQGQLIAGEQTRHLLPGTAPPDAAPSDLLPSMRQIQLAQHSTAAESAETSRREMSTTSIRLSKTWRDRIASQPKPGSRSERFSRSTNQSSTLPSAQTPSLPQDLPPNPDPWSGQTDRSSTRY